MLLLIRIDDTIFDYGIRQIIACFFKLIPLFAPMDEVVDILSTLNTDLMGLCR